MIVSNSIFANSSLLPLLNPQTESQTKYHRTSHFRITDEQTKLLRPSHVRVIDIQSKYPRTSYFRFIDGQAPNTSELTI